MGNKLIICINPTEGCNLSCRYCRVPENVKIGTMSYNILGKIFEDIESRNEEEIYVIWYGGEPTLVGESFYKMAINLEKEVKGKMIKNGIQTNGTLLTEALIRLFKAHSFRIGISLDGTKRIHDENRIYKDGLGFYEKIMKSIKLLNKLKANFATLTLLTNKNIRFIKEIYFAIRKTGANGAKFEVFCPGGRGKKYKNEFFVKPSEYTTSMLTLYNLWMHKDERIKFRVDPLDKIIESFFTGQSRACEYAGVCGSNFQAISSNGDIYPCGRFVGITRFKVGNISSDSLEGAYNHKVSEFIRKKRKEVKLKCIRKGCKYVDICNGGCAYESYTIFGDLEHRTIYCPSRRRIFDYIYRDLKKQRIL